MSSFGPGLGQPDAHRAADRLAIAELLGHHYVRLDEGDVDGALMIFTDDAAFVEGGVVVEGRDAMQPHFRSDGSGAGFSHHQLGQSIVSFGAGHDTAEALTYVTVWKHHDGDPQIAHIRLVDELLRTREGWRVRRREVVSSS